MPDGETVTPGTNDTNLDAALSELQSLTKDLERQNTKNRQFVYDLIALRNTLASQIGTVDKTLTNHHHAFANVRYGERITIAHIIEQLEQWALAYQAIDEYSPCIVFHMSDDSYFVNGTQILAGNTGTNAPGTADANLDGSQYYAYDMRVDSEPIPVKIGSIIRMPRIDPTWISKEEHVFVGWSEDRAASWAGPYLSSGYTNTMELPVLVDEENPEESTYGGATPSPSVEGPLGTGAGETVMKTVTFSQPPDVYRIPWDISPSSLTAKTKIVFYPVFAPSVINYVPYK